MDYFTGITIGDVAMVILVIVMITGIIVDFRNGINYIIRERRKNQQR